MNHYGIQQKNAVTVSVSFEKSEHMICPKPKRLSLFNTPINEPVKPLRWHMCYQQEPYESKATLDLLEIIFEKPCDSSPPFFSGSPPRRVSNPLTQDIQFGSGNSSLSFSERKTGHVGGNFGNKPAVRIEGFNCGITAKA